MKREETLKHYEAIAQDETEEYGDRLDAFALYQQTWLSDELRLVLDRFIGGKCDCLVDFGCGTGWCLPVLREYGKRVIGIDISTPLLGVAGSFLEATGNSDRVELIHYDGISLPFADNSVDCLFEWDVMHHLETVDNTLSEFRRILKKDGILIGVEPNVLNFLIAVYHAKRKHERGCFVTNRFALSRKLSRFFEVSHVYSNNIAISYNNPFYRGIIKQIDPIFTKWPFFRLFSLRFLFVARKSGPEYDPVSRVLGSKEV